MPRGRKPQGDQALSNAQRQARYRARRAAAKPLPAIPSRRPIRPPSRPQRWHAAVSVLIATQAEYAAWYDALPPLRLCARSSSSISTNWPRSTRLAAMHETDPIMLTETLDQHSIN
jgi:hypothetical protein